MRDFPVFTTECGVGSLVLKEIPYSGAAYITIRDASDPNGFLSECTDFCKAVGALNIYASGHCILETYPLYTSVIKMTAPLVAFPETESALFPVTEKTIDRWREIYNDKMKNVPNASYMSQRAGAELLKNGNGYFVHRDGELYGIGVASEGTIHCVASVIPGKGREVVLALLHALTAETVDLEVASENPRAIRLYESMGFIKVSEVSRWYKIFGDVKEKYLTNR